jgi:hypothetical protein
LASHLFDLQLWGDEFRAEDVTDGSTSELRELDPNAGDRPVELAHHSADRWVHGFAVKDSSQQFNRTSIEEEMFLQSNAQNAWKKDQWQRSPHD